MVAVLRWLTAGESHGPALVAVLEGLPAGVRITTDDVADALARRRAGYGRGARMSFERDEVDLLGGVRHGRTLGGPVAIRIGNTEWPKWETVMGADPVPAEELDGLARNAPLTRPAARARRPGRHAEVRLRRRAAGAGAGQRPGDRGPGRARRGGQGVPGPGARRDRAVPRGARSATVAVPYGTLPGPDDLAAVDASPVRCFDPVTSDAMVAEIDAARKDGDTLGGVVEVVAHGLPPGLGSHVHGDRRLDARLAGGADGHPGDQGRRARRRVRPGPPPRLRRRTTRSRAARPGCAGAPAAPAAPRAG